MSRDTSPPLSTGLQVSGWPEDVQKRSWKMMDPLNFAEFYTTNLFLLNAEVCFQIWAILLVDLAEGLARERIFLPST